MLRRGNYALLALLFGAAAFAGKPATDPIEVSLLGSDIRSDTGDPYTHDVGGVHAVLPGTGNIVLDPDRNARRKDTPRSIVLELPALGERDAYFMSINSVGLTCGGGSDTTPPRDLEAGDCIQSELAINEIADSDYFLICGGEFTEVGLTNVHVSCEADDGAGCTEWDIFSPGGTVECALFEYQRVKKKGLVLTQVTPPFPMGFDAYVSHLGGS